MNVIEKQRLSKEAKMQIKALKRIVFWKRIAYLISVIGVALTYAGAAGIRQNVFLIILGIVLILVSITTAIKSQCFNSRSLEYISTFYVEKNKIPFHCVFVNNA